MKTQICIENTLSIESLLEENRLLREKVVSLQAQIDWFTKQIFGKKSERVVQEPSTLQPYLPGLQPEHSPQPKIEQKTIAQHTRRVIQRDRKDAITFSEDLPRERYVIDIPEEEKVCAETGVPLVKIGEEITQKLMHKPGSFYIKEIVRPKYASKNIPEAGVAIAELPESLLNRCIADESLLAEILVKKYADHLPLHRQSEIFSREGVCISRQILCQWVMRAGKALKPLKDCMTKRILESGSVFVDETPLKMLSPGKGKTQQVFMWVLSGGFGKNPPYRIYEFYENRKHCNAEKLLNAYGGILHSDKYGAYEKLAQAGQFTWCPCFAHIRRKFVDAIDNDSAFCHWVLRKIRYLFMFERIAWDKSPEKRLKIRQEKEIPILDELISAIKNYLVEKTVLPKSKLREALVYFINLLPYLKNYTTHSQARIDNNVAERALRPLAIGRKNWLFVGSEDGGEVAATLYSLIQTCRAIDVNPREYLEDVMRRLMSHPANKLHELLPDHWAASNRTPISIQQ